MPTQTTILGAAKLSGKVRGWSVGSLAALTAREESRLLLSAPSVRDTLVTAEPMAQYFVGRARRELRAGQVLLGGMMTAVHRNLADSVSRARLRSDALAGGLDFKHEIANRAWVVSGSAALSRISGEAASIVAVQSASNHFFQRPDATHLSVDSSATSLFGYTTSLNVDKQSGEHWRGGINGAITSPGYEVNDLGFAVRTDRRDLQANLHYQENQPSPRVRRWQLSQTVRSERNFAGQPILNFAALSGYAQSLDYWTISANVLRFFRAFDDRLTRGGPLARRPGWTTGSLFVGSDSRAPITVEVEADYTRTEADAWQQELSVEVGFKSSSWWNLEIEPSLSRGLDQAQFLARVPDAAYAETYGDRYIFAPLRQTELTLETRFNATFTPALSLEMYLQPLISAGDFGQAKQLVRAKSYEFMPYAAAAAEPDFNFRSLRGNAVLRWEWREGSTMYVAWQQSRSDEAPIGDFDFGRDRSALFGTRPDNIFLVKLNYWLNP